MTSKDAQKRIFEEISSIPGVEWFVNSQTKGILHVNEEISIEFNVKGMPSFKIEPKEARARLPQVIELLPELALWDDESEESAPEMLQQLKSKILVIVSGMHMPESDLPRIARKAILGLLEVAKKGHPNESIYLIKRDPLGVLSEVIVPPGGQGGPVMSIFSPSRLPGDRLIEATFHSHPSGNGHWSRQDLRMFVQYKVNIIAYFPYGADNFKVYDAKGNPIDYEVV
jgi:hypothetical protein